MYPLWFEPRKNDNKDRMKIISKCIDTYNVGNEWNGTWSLWSYKANDNINREWMFLVIVLKWSITLSRFHSITQNFQSIFELLYCLSEFYSDFIFSNTRKVNAVFSNSLCVYLLVVSGFIGLFFNFVNIKSLMFVFLWISLSAWKYRKSDILCFKKYKA